MYKVCIHKHRYIDNSFEYTWDCINEKSFEEKIDGLLYIVNQAYDLLKDHTSYRHELNSTQPSFKEDLITHLNAINYYQEHPYLFEVKQIKV